MAKCRGKQRDQLSDLPDSILIHILSMLSDGRKDEVVRTSVLSTRWRSLWKSVPVSLYFSPSGYHNEEIHDFVASTHRELHYWRSCEKIKKFSIDFYSCEERFVKDVDLWVYFAIKVANVEDFALEFSDEDGEAVCEYKFPQYAYKNTSLRNLVLGNCILNPTANVNWSSLVFLSIRDLKLIEGVIEKVLSGCPNLECLELDSVSGIHRLEISNEKLRELIISDIRLEILAPYIQTLQLLRLSPEMCLKNIASLVTAVLDFGFRDRGQLQKKETSCLKKLLHSVAHVKNLALGCSCNKYLSLLEREGWQPPPSNWKFLKLDSYMEQSDFPGICSFLQSSSNLETLVIDGYNCGSKDLLSKYINEDERNRGLRHITITFGDD